MATKRVGSIVFLLFWFVVLAFDCFDENQFPLARGGDQGKRDAGSTLRDEGSAGHDDRSIGGEREVVQIMRCGVCA